MSTIAVATPACDVRKPPYNAAGDNKTDDTAVLQRAIDECEDVLLSGPGRVFLL